MRKLVIPLQTSNYAKALYGLIYGLSLISLLLAPLALVLKILTVFLISAYLAHIVKKTVFFAGPQAIKQLYFEDGLWFITLGERTVEVKILGDSMLSQVFCALHVQEVLGRKHSCLIFRDSVIATDYRRLLVYLRYS
jgi:hypothetical protein